MSLFEAQPPTGIDPTGVSEEGAVAYALIRDDIISGRLQANDRLVVAELSERHGISANPVREALQLLRAQGFVLMAHNKGARVRPIDENFVRDIYEIGVLTEPSLVKWFVGMATDEDIVALEDLQSAIEANNFADAVLHSRRDLVEAPRGAARHGAAVQLHAGPAGAGDPRPSRAVADDQGRRWRWGSDADCAACRWRRATHSRADAGGERSARQLVPARAETRA